MASGYQILDHTGMHNMSDYPGGVTVVGAVNSDNGSQAARMRNDLATNYDYVTSLLGDNDSYTEDLTTGVNPFAAVELADWINTSQTLDLNNWAAYYNKSDWPDYNGTGEFRDTAAAITKGLFLGALITMTICGNVLVLLAVFVNAHLRSTTHYFIANLAVADLLLGTTVLPFSASLEVIDKWVFGQLFCDIWAAVDVLCCTASIMGLCVISIDRYIGVTRPLQHSSIMTEKRASLIIVMVWVLSVAISVAPLLGWKEPPPDDPNICDVTKQLGYVLFSVSGSFYIPLAIILVVYYRVYREALNQSRFLKTGIKTSKSTETNNDVTLRIHMGGKSKSCGKSTSQVNVQAKGNVYQSSSSSEHSEESGRKAHTKFTLAGKIAKFNREKKAAKTLGIVVGVFILCWLPFFFVLPLEALCSVCYVPEWLFKIIFWLGYCNSMMNPIIYAMSSREFKRAFIRILKCQWRRRPRSFLQGVYFPNTMVSNHYHTTNNRRNPSSMLCGWSKRLRKLTNPHRKCNPNKPGRRGTVNFSMAAILYTSQVSHTRRFEGESPLSSLKLLQDRRKQTVDAIVISDDESGAIHEESDIDDDECACADDPESSVHRKCYQPRECCDLDDSDPDTGVHLLDTRAEILLNGNGIVPSGDCIGTSGTVHSSDAHCSDTSVHCHKQTTPPVTNSYNWNSNSNPAIIIDEVGFDNHIHQINKTSMSIKEQRGAGNDGSLVRVVTSVPNPTCRDDLGAKPYNMVDKIMYL